MPHSNRDHFNRALTPVDRSGITELVVERIKELLEQGELKSGSRLPPERELATLLNISRPSLRTALKALSVMGIIHARPGAGTYISDSVQEIFHQPFKFAAALNQTKSAELFEARRLIETGLAELAAERASEADLRAIAAEVEAMQRTRGNPEKFLEHDVRFHQAIARAAGNAVMSGVMDTLTHMLYQVRRATIAQADDFDAASAWHERIYKAISEGNKSLARELMFDHLTDAERGWEQQKSSAGKKHRTVSRRTAPRRAGS